MSKKSKSILFILIALITVGTCVWFLSKPSDLLYEQSEIEKLTQSHMGAKKAQHSGTIFKYNDILFSLPSPYQISLLLERSNVAYDETMLNPTSNANNYLSSFSKAINFGVYGADLGYINIYGQTQRAASYFAIIKILSQDIGLYEALTKSTINRIEGNIENRDSLLHIVSNTYRRINNYLKVNDRDDTGSLILAGGWIEAMYILCQQTNDNYSEKLAIRIFEQKRPLNNLIKILVPFSNDSKEIKFLVDSLIDLGYVFDEIEERYTYVPPITYPEKKLTKIMSQSEIVIGKKRLEDVRQKIARIREFACR
ncbi:MAG: hypothetical protein N4A49_08110 [Marinifilaceae bacterium]|jgi:hypothetical protein|nr:hypothetical protein [Marinifilaceae bacterium]